MIPVGWEQRVELCETEHEVVQVTREFLAMLEPWEVALLPESCKPRKLFTAADVSDYAFDVVSWERDHANRSVLVAKMATFFSRASIRLSQLALSAMNDGNEDSRQSA